MDRFSAFDSALERNRWWGVYPALVTDIKDPDAQGRVKIKLPWCPDNSGGGYEVWARVAVLMGGNQRGTWFIPDPNRHDFHDPIPIIRHLVRLPYQRV